jgi:hypothetical protein
MIAPAEVTGKLFPLPGSTSHSIYPILLQPACMSKIIVIIRLESVLHGAETENLICVSIYRHLSALEISATS